MCIIIFFILDVFPAFRGRSRGFRRGFGDRMMDTERRGEEESAPDSQDLSSAASLDRGNLFFFSSIFFFFNGSL